MCVALCLPGVMGADYSIADTVRTYKSLLCWRRVSKFQAKKYPALGDTGLKESQGSETVNIASSGFTKRRLRDHFSQVTETFVVAAWTGVRRCLSGTFA